MALGDLTQLERMGQTGEQGQREEMTLEQRKRHHRDRTLKVCANFFSAYAKKYDSPVIPQLER